jgi:hypothetical protein
MSESRKGIVFTQEHCDNISKAKNPFNKPRKYKKDIIPMVDGHHAPAALLKISNAVKKGLENMLEEDKIKRRENLSKSLKGKTKSKEWRRKISESNKGRSLTEECKKKMSDSAKKRGPPFKGKTPEEIKEIYRKISEKLRNKNRDSKGEFAQLVPSEREIVAKDLENQSSS